MSLKTRYADWALSRIKKPSRLVAIALGDFEKVTARNDVDVNMSDWVRRYPDYCTVCFAGAVMLGRLGLQNHPCSYLSKNQLFALNHFRAGAVKAGFDQLGIPIPDNLPPTVNISDHIRGGPDPKFISAMRNLQKMLAGAGQ